MIKDLIRVGPPQGTIDDLDLKVPKEFDKNIRKDFEKELKAAGRDKEKDQPKAEKKDDQKKDSDQVSKKSSGGIKKKMARAKDDESDAEKPEANVTAEAVVQPIAIDQKISNVMVSDEGEVEIADSEKNLQQIATGQQFANIQNIQTEVLAEGTAVSAEAQPQGALEAAPEFQYMTNAEKAVLAELNGEAQPAVLEQLLKSPAGESAALEQQMIQPMQDANVEESAAPTLESKVFDILSKEAAKPADLKLVQQDAAQAKDQALNQTSAVLAKSSAENEKQGQGEKQNSSGDSGQQASLPKFDGSNDLAAQVSALHTGQRSFQSHLGAAAGAAGAAAAAKPGAETDAMKDSNVREVMNQAKYLVTAGGGEMTVKMTPEGMGEVNLKVMLDNGKINIEMNAQDKSVKKMLEESLSDLKSSLASHQMRVEHVKINNVVAVDTQNQAQFQSDANSSNSSFQNRQQQEMNFQNFANSNSGRQREHGSSYQTSQQQSVQTPIAKSTQGRAAYVAANKGSSVNVVA